MRRTLLLVFVLVFSTASSQEQDLLKGQIITDSLEASSINIVNLQREIGSTNTSFGSFKIKAGVGDTLLFSSVQYEIRKIVVTPDILKKSFLKVVLVPLIYELDEVRINNISLSGNLNADLANIEAFDQASVGFPMSSAPKRTAVDRRIYTASSSPLLLILNTLNGRLKMLKRAKKNMEYESFIDLGVNILPTEFFTDYLQIPEDKIRLFVYYCGEDPRLKPLLIKQEALSIVELYLEKAAEFREMNSMKTEHSDPLSPANAPEAATY